MNRDGVSCASARFTDSVPLLLGILGTFALSWVASATTGAWWIWIVAALVAAGIVLRTGHYFNEMIHAPQRLRICALRNSRSRLWLSLTPDGALAYSAHVQALQQIVAAEDA